jgi:hypothetical protein
MQAISPSTIPRMDVTSVDDIINYHFSSEELGSEATLAVGPSVSEDVNIDGVTQGNSIPCSVNNTQTFHHFSDLLKAPARVQPDSAHQTLHGRGHCSSKHFLPLTRVLYHKLAQVMLTAVPLERSVRSAVRDYGATLRYVNVSLLHSLLENAPHL